MKTMIIGIDGASFDLMKHLLEEGKLPNLKRLMDGGCHAPLRSAWPFITPVAWTSLYTGKNPGKHGVVGFTEYNDDPEMSSFRPSDATSIRSKPIWDLLAESGHKSLLVNLPMTFPPQLDKGQCISGWGTPDTGSDFGYPPEIRNDILRRFPDFSVGFHPERANDNWGSWLAEKINQEKLKKDVALYLMEKDDYSFVFVAFEAPDKVCHMCWDINQDKGLLEELGIQEPPIDTSYTSVDAHIGELLKDADDDLNIIVCSDHGFGSMKKFFLLNNWLKQEGFLVLKKRSLSNIFKLYELHWRDRRLARIFNRLQLNFLNKHLPPKVRMLRIRIPIIQLTKKGVVIDWDKTKAYANNYGIYINLRGRERTGIVNEGKEYFDLVKDIQERLLKVVDPDTGVAIIESIFNKNETYIGENAKFACDVLFKLKDDYFQHHQYAFKTNFLKRNMGTHRLHGIFIACGPAFQKGVKLDEADITDICPTILAINNSPIPRDLDGRVIDEILSPEFVEDLDIRYSDQPSSLKTSDDNEDVYNSEQRKKVEDQLKLLGYL